MPKKVIPKLTPEEVARFVRARAARKSTNDPDRASVQDQQLASKTIDVIPDELVKRKLYTMLKVYPKYRAIEFMIHPAGEFMKRYPEVMQELAADLVAGDAVKGANAT